MPWQKGIGSRIYKDVGRKGYEVEQAQLEKMKTVLNGVIELSESVINKKKKITKERKEDLRLLLPFANKIMDKLHASKTDIGFDEDKPFLVKNETAS
jgi:hypothetical protein